MPGFIGAFGDFDKNLLVCERSKYIKVPLIENEKSTDNFVVKQSTINKFSEDKVCFENDKMIVVVEGVIYNYTSLKAEYGVSDNASLLACLYNSHGNSLIDMLNGNFCMCLYDKFEGMLYLYANHTGFKPLYYFSDNQKVIFSSDISWLMKTVKDQNSILKLNHDATVSLLTHGYMLENLTLAQEIYKVQAGHYISVSSEGIIEDNTYSSYGNIHKSELGYNELLERANDLFIQAVRRIYDKDDEYGYKHVCTLSGGLDSRSVAFIANELGYEQLFITIGESGCLDEKVSTQIARDLKAEHLILHLDHGGYLLDTKPAILGNGGMILYPGFLHLYSLFDKLNLTDYGSIHTGELGDIVFGGSKSDCIGKKVNIMDGAFSGAYLRERNFSDLFKSKINKKYKDSFSFVFNNRAFNSALNGWLASYYYTESSSPFMDKEFMEFCDSITKNNRENSKIYIDWMEKYHPRMCNYLWTTTRTKPNAKGSMKKLKKALTAFRVRVLREQLSMNPYDSWRKSNIGLETMINKIISKDIEQIFKGDVQIQSICTDIKQSNNTNSIFMLCTLLLTMEEFSIEC